MSQQRILITGGGGFIGSRLADELLQYGHNVRALDILAYHVHGSGAPDYLDPDVELMQGDGRDPVVVRRALQGIDAVYQFAVAVGVGQSTYEIERYSDFNSDRVAFLSYRSADLIKRNALKPNFLYTHKFTLDQLPDALDALAERPEGFLKGWITF